MILRLPVSVICCAGVLLGQVKTKLYVDPPSCFATYRLAPGRILTSRGLIEDPTVNSLMKDAVSTQMKERGIAEADNDAGLIVRFMGGNGVGLQVDDLAVGDIAMWDIGGPGAIPGRSYKKTTLVIAVIDAKSNRTLWAARCSDKFGDPCTHKRAYSESGVEGLLEIAKENSLWLTPLRQKGSALQGIRCLSPSGRVGCEVEAIVQTPLSKGTLCQMPLKLR